MSLGRPFLARGGAIGACALALAIARGDDTQSRSLRLVKHAPVQVHRDEHGNRAHSKNSVLVGSETANWSGYEVATFQTHVADYRSASATWTVPGVKFGTTNRSLTATEYSSTWVGIGGFCENTKCSAVDQSLIQLGTEQDAARSGQTQYYAWVELLPAFPLVIAKNGQPNCDSLSCAQPVAPGDVIAATLSCTANCSSNNQTWLLTMTNTSLTHASWNYETSVSYDSSQQSAVFIQEAPTGAGGGILPLAEPLAPVAFAATAANGNETSGMTIQVNGIAMFDPAGQSSTPSQVALVDQFNACWAVTRSPTVCSPP
jgi:hypothetical protein